MYTMVITWFGVFSVHMTLWTPNAHHHTKRQPLHYSLDPLISFDIPTIYCSRIQHNVSVLSTFLSSVLITQSNWYNRTSHIPHQWGISFAYLKCKCFI